MIKVYIIILNYRNWKDVTDCFSSVLLSAYTNFSVIIIDNDSGNNSLFHISEYLSHSFPALKLPVIISADKLRQYLSEKLVLVQNEHNMGFGAGINPVISQLLSEDAFIWLLNPDTTVQPDTLKELVQFSLSLPQRSIIGAKIHLHKDPSLPYLYGGGKIMFRSGTIQRIRSYKKVSRIDYISGTCLFTHTHSFRELGLLPEDYFLYWEETEWCYLAKKAGYKLEVCSSAICFDKESTSIGKSFLADYYYTRNGLSFVLKFRKAKLPLAVISAFFRAIKRVLKGDLQRANGVFTGMKAFLSGNES